MTRTRNRTRPIRRTATESASTTTHRGELLTAVEAPRIITEATRPGRLLIQLIKAGWSLNDRYYPAEVLRRDGPHAWPAGTLNFVDHPTDDEDEERPAGSLRNLASYQTEAARWDEARQALVAEVRIYAPWREAVTDWAMSGAVGMSIRAWVYGEDGEAEGRKGVIITEIEQGRSVDYVTIPAAGGAMLTVLESAGPPNPSRRAATAEARSIGVWLESRLHLTLTQLGDDMYGQGRLTRDERITLSSAIGDALTAWTARVESDAPQLFRRDLWDEPSDTASGQADEARVAETTADETRQALTAALCAAHGGDDVYVWLRDYDPDEGLVWFQLSTEDSCRTMQQAYTAAAGTITLTGDPIEVVARTVYTPVPATPSDVEPTAEATAPPSVWGAPTPVTESAPAPPAPTHPSTNGASMSGNHTNGPAPGQGGSATTGQTPTLTPAMEARVLLAEQQRDEALARAAALTEAQNAAATERVRADAAVAEARRLRADNAGRDAVTRAMAESFIPDSVRALMTPRVMDRVIGRVPCGESGDVDATGLTATVTAAIEAERTYAAALLEAQGAGSVRGLGSTGTTDDITDDVFEAELAGVFGRVGMTNEAAQRAAKGR